MVHSLFWVGCALAVCVLLAIGYAVLWAWNSAKKEVNKVPREPMLICEVHGMYPEKHAMELDVPNTETGTFKMCPFCVKERVSKKKVS